MIEFDHLIAFIVLTACMSLIPGPSVLYVLSQGLCRDARRVVFAVLGIVLSNLVWVSLCTAGVAVIIRESQQLFTALKYAGACYLIYLGIRHWTSPSGIQRTVTESIYNLRFSFIKGFLTSISNPKALIFYLSFLPQFLHSQELATEQTLILGLVNIGVLGCVLMIYGLLANRISVALLKPVVKSYLTKVFGTVFIGFGVSLLRFKEA